MKYNTALVMVAATFMGSTTAADLGKSASNLLYATPDNLCAFPIVADAPLFDAASSGRSLNAFTFAPSTSRPNVFEFS